MMPCLEDVKSPTFLMFYIWAIKNKSMEFHSQSNNNRINQQPDLHVRLDGRGNPTFRL